MSGSGIFNVHELENDASKVLLEIDVPTLMCFMAGYGVSCDRDRESLIRSWGFTRDESEQTNTDYNKFMTSYSDAKENVIRAFRKYLDAPPF